MLRGITEVLEKRGPMSLADLSLHLKTEVSALEPMLETLERKGRIRRIETKCSKCKGCVSMKSEDAAIYRCLAKRDCRMAGVGC